MSGRDPRPRQSIWRRVLVALTATATAVASLTLAAGKPAGAKQNLEFVGFATFPVDSEALVVDSVAERIVQIKNDTSNAVIPWFDITIHRADGTTLGSHREEMAFAGAHLSFGSPTAWYLDSGARTLYVVAYTTIPVQTGLPRNASAVPRLMAFNIANPAAIQKLSDRPIASLPAGVQPFGITIHKPSGRMYIVAQTVPTGGRAFNVFVAEFDPGASNQVLQPSLPPIPVRGCQRVVADRQPAAIVRRGDAVFIACAPSTDLNRSIPIGLTSSIQEVNLADPSKSRVHFLPGTYVQGDSFVDPGAGSEGRLVLVGSAPLRPGQAVWVFDLAHRTFVTTVPAGGITGAAVDTQSGRIYVAGEVRGQPALIVSSDRGFPPPGALPPSWGVSDIIESTLGGRVIPVSFNKTVMVPVDPVTGPNRYAIFRDNTSDADLPIATEPDFTTLDGETTGEDTPNVSGNAQAFGMRIHLIGGLSNLRSNLDAADPNWWNQPLAGNQEMPTPAEIAGVDDGDRDLYFGRVEGATLSNDEAAAIAGNLVTESRTKADWTSLTARFNRFMKGQDPTDPNGAAGDPWPSDDAQCGVFGKGSDADAGTKPDWVAGAPASTTCDMDKGFVEAMAPFGGVDPAKASALVSVGSTTTRTRLDRTDAGGIAVIAEAEARDIVIGGALTIGRARSRASSESFGGHQDLAGNTTKGAAAANYERWFENVTGPGISCAKECDPTAVVAAISDVLGAQVRVELPAFHKLETPAGAHAHAWREPWELQQDVLVNQQAATQQEVPALRIMFVGDRDLPSRLIFEFAATKADAKHIKTLEVPPEPEIDDVDDDLAVGDIDVEFSEAVPEIPAEPPLKKTVVLGGRAGPAAAEFPPAVGQSFLERLFEQGGKFALRALGGLLMTLALFTLFGVPPFLATRRRHLAKLAQPSR